MKRLFYNILDFLSDEENSIILLWTSQIIQGLVIIGILLGK